MRMTNVEARKLLGLEEAMPDLTEAIITRAYRAALLDVHPDTAAPAGLTGDRRTVDQLKEAREVLRQAATGTDFCCVQCRGRGKVRGKFGAVTCGACKGTGDKAP